MARPDQAYINPTGRHWTIPDQTDVNPRFYWDRPDQMPLSATLSPEDRRAMHDAVEAMQHEYTLANTDTPHMTAPSTRGTLRYTTSEPMMSTDKRTLTDMKSRLDCIESILSNTPGYESAVTIAVNAADYSDDLNSLLHEFDKAAIERGLIDISDPENRALAELCRSVLRKADKAARKTQHAKEAVARRATSPELDGARISYLRTRLDDLDKAIASTEGKRQREDRRVKELEDYVDKLVKSFTEYKERQDKLIQAFSAALADPMGKLTQMEEFLSVHRNNIDRFFGSDLPNLQSRLCRLEVQLNSGAKPNRPFIDWLDNMRFTSTTDRS